MDKYIGLSLSGCVKDILKGRIKEENVVCIISGTWIQSEDYLNKVIEKYTESYWIGHPDEAPALARRLFFSGKLIQPKVFKLEPIHTPRGHWVRFDDEQLVAVLRTMQETLWFILHEKEIYL